MPFGGAGPFLHPVPPPCVPCVPQAVIQGAFTSEDAVETEAAATETHYTYFPTAAVADAGSSASAGTAATAVVTTQSSEALLGQPTPTGMGRTLRGGGGHNPWDPQLLTALTPFVTLCHSGQFFVMMSPQEVLQGGAQRSITPRAHPYSP